LSSITADKIKNMKRAVVALDLTSSDDKIISYLRDNIQFLGIEKIHFAHILPEKLNMYPVTSGLWEPWTADAMNSVLEELRRKIEPYFKPEKGKIEFHISKGDPLEELLAVAEGNSADLVVIGQKSGVKKHGVLAKNFVRNVSCKGLIIPEDRPDEINHILVPVDFSPFSSKSLKIAIDLSKRSERMISITALHVYEMPALGYYKLSMTEKKFRNAIKSNIENSLIKYIESQLGEDAARIQVKAISRGVPGISSYLTEYAMAANVDFVIMGAKGHSKIKLLMMGSVAEGMLNSNQFLPTLIIR